VLVLCWVGPVAAQTAESAQWQRKADKFDLVITANKTAPNIPVGGELQLLS